MKLLRLTCGVSANIKSKQDFTNKYQNIGLSVKVYSEKWMLIKPDEHCFTTFRKISLKPVLTKYKQLLWETVCEVNRENYSSWVSDQVKTTLLDVKEYEQKTYKSSIVDIIIVALAEVASVKLTAYNANVYYEMQSITKSLANP